MKNLTALVALMSVFALAICFVVIGAVSVELKSALQINNAEIGTLVLTLFLTACIVGIFIGPLVDKLGHKPIAVAGFLVCAGGVILLGYATGFDMALCASFLLGVGAMCVNTVGNTLIPVVLFNGKDPARASNFGNAFFGLGLICTPLIVSISGSHFRSVLFFLGAVLLVFLLFSLGASYPKVSTGFKLSMAVTLLGKAPVIMAAIALACYISLESTMTTWIKPLMNELFITHAKSNSSALAGFVLSLFGVAMTLGRFMSSMIKNLTRIGIRIVILASAISILAIMLMSMTKNIYLVICAVTLVGLVFAPIFPIIVGVTFSRFEPRLYGSIFGLIFSVGLLGGTFIPQYVGALSEGKSIQQGLWVAVIMAGVLCVITMILGKCDPRDRKERENSL